AGRIGPTEAGLMITEKIAAANEAQAVATTFVSEGGNALTAAKKIKGLRRIEWAIFGAGCLTKLCIV
ncbi:MAG TPA: hypothetical protein VIX91_15775, partial [Candidatus Acidoferrum sp.]